MEDKIFDVGIVGAGPAGIGVLKGVKGKYVVFDNGIRDEYLATENETIKKFKLEKAVLKKYDNFVMRTKNKIVKKPMKKYGFSLIDLAKIKPKKHKGKVVDAKKCEGYIKLKSDKWYKCRRVIDCSGEGIVAQKLGFDVKKNKYSCCYFLEVEMKAGNDIVFYMNNDYSNNCSWIYPMGKNKAQIGIAHVVDKKRKIDLKNNLRKAMKDLGYEYKIKKEQYYCYPIHHIKHMVYDNLILVGNSAGQATPAFAEGFSPAINMGYIAGRYPEKYEEEWKKRYGKSYFWNNLILKVMSNLRDDEKDIIIENENKMSEKDYYKIIQSKVDFWLFLKGFSWKFVKKFIQNRINI